ncbi:hypothetical protein Poli38472_000548 [Pythium oligandrum]|uniref:Uncharacterized protein n=1 Tax=Pythium oligandrum TaxID=41045 RepID=A0A8K1CCP4_PYTOL|nr:hypothetical protein Poli38472_000548 [Pythium oligandrum]|eukprot:TMW60506.1 hypothetical protein Poli38472_000548 [Pythium oligandrum]
MSWLETELHDDPATLQAALAMLDEMDDSPSSSEVSDLSADLIPYGNDALEAENAKTTRMVTGNRTRNRQRNELLYLREKVAQMEETLAALRQSHGASGSENAVVVSKAARLWEDLAGQQHEHRRAAELENAKLRAMLRTQITTGRDLMRLIRKSSRGLDESSMLVRTRRRGDVGASASVDDLFVRLQELYSLTDTVFSNVPSGENITMLRDFTTSEDDPNTTTVNSYSTWTLPFPMERVVEATWQSVVRESTKAPALGVSEDDKAEKTFSTFRWDASEAFKWMQGEIHGRMGAKKFADHAPNEAVMGAITMEGDAFDRLYERLVVQSKPRSSKGGVKRKSKTLLKKTKPEALRRDEELSVDTATEASDPTETTLPSASEEPVDKESARQVLTRMRMRRNFHALSRQFRRHSLTLAVELIASYSIRRKLLRLRIKQRRSVWRPQLTRKERRRDKVQRGVRLEGIAARLHKRLQRDSDSTRDQDDTSKPFYVLHDIYFASPPPFHSKIHYKNTVDSNPVPPPPLI